MRYTEHEFCLLIEGRVRLESAGGERHDLRAGDAFVVPRRVRRHLEVVEPCKKWYAIFEAKGDLRLAQRALSDGAATPPPLSPARGA